MGMVLSNNGPSTNFDWTLVGPAVEVALERSLREYNIAFAATPYLYTGYCDELPALAQVVRAVEDSVDVLLGPSCTSDLVLASKLTAVHKLLLMTGGGASLENTDAWPYVVRTAYNSGGLWRFFGAMCGQFEWKNTFVLYDLEAAGQYSQLAKPLIDNMRKMKRYPYDYPVKSSELTGPKKADAILQEATLQARIIVLLINPKKIRQFMIQAQRRGMCNGDYAFFVVDIFKTDFLASAPQSDVMDDSEASSQCYALFILTLSYNREDPAVKAFAQQVRARSPTGSAPLDVNYYSTTFHDAVLIYAAVLNETIEDGRALTKDNIDYIAKKFNNRTFQGCIGPLYMDSSGDRAADFELYQTVRREAGAAETTPAFVKVAQYIGARGVYEEVKKIQWLNEENKPVANRPLCDYDGNAPDCLNAARALLGGALGGAFLFVMLTGFGGFAVYRQIQWRKELNNLDWLAAWHEIYIHQRVTSIRTASVAASQYAAPENPENPKGNAPPPPAPQGDRNRSVHRLGSKSTHSLQKSFTTKESVMRTTTIVASLRNTLTLMRPCPGASVQLSAELRAEVRVVKSFTCESLLKFLAACIEPDHVTVMSEYCSRGSLQDVLQNDTIALDWVFRFSFINDIVSALLYLQASPLQQHGRLTSRCCFIDKRFLLKIGDYGLPIFYNSVKVEVDASDFLWTAPEMLRSTDSSGHPRASSEGDVYAFSIILSEIILRESPYYLNNIPIDDVVKKVKKGERPIFRPLVQDSFCQEEIMLMMRSCWAEDPVERPKFAQIRGSLRNLSKTNGRQRENIIDTLIERMEQYAASLEVSVDEKTHALVEEKKKTEQLLYSILPRAVAEQLKRGEAVLPESYDSVTIYFGDIVEFTTLSAASSPNDIVTLMNDLYCRFDEIIATFDAYKVETIGDCYVIVSGLPHRNGQQHAGEIAKLALTLRETMLTFTVRHMPEKRLQLRIGLNSGPCVAGVVGFATPRYCLFGDTVNVAARMESTGEAMKIQITQTTEAILRCLGAFHTELRGVVQVKGKGEMQTFWLVDVERG
ncbi:Atrial natriuretic peptide receptor 2 [Hypsibius exemplaris]|uniref:Guanylate cyclase n=1 Tax=Hypsibius exemplaris TaxID=2072580 RepID=A0A9X6RLT6_HYPEX|nr:Atrial natriuretic peptide receptor 2 [Hypsibius exemplaris]